MNQNVNHRANTSRLINASEVQRAYGLFVEPGQVIEIRALEAAYKADATYLQTFSGFFDNSLDLIRELSRLQKAMGIYFTLQQCKPALLHRAKNKLISAKKDGLTSDKDIKRYRWLFFDCDVTNADEVSGISATEQEHDQAIAFIYALAKRLCDEFHWAKPIIGDSGNGGYLLFRIDLFIDDKELYERVLEAIAQLCDTPEVHIDQKVFNPARIAKLFGTRACKGDNTSERPHRMARLLEVPEQIQIVTREQLEQIASTFVAYPQQQEPTSTYTTRKNSGNKEPFTAEAFLQKYKIPVKSVDPYESGVRYQLEACVWDPSHTDHSACVYQWPDGRLGASCSHNSCKGKGWKDFRAVFEPDAYQEIKEPPTQIRLMEIAKEAHFINTPSGALFARVPVNGRYEINSINERGAGFRRWLTYTFHKIYGYAPNSDALTQAISAVEAMAQYEGERAKVYTRLAEKNGHIYLDLCNDKWQCIEISSGGWRVIDCPPVYFRRPNGMLPLPIPQRGGSLKDLRRLINAKSEKDYVLIIAWLLGTLHPTGPYPGIAFNGERGSAKTYASKVLRNTVDPNEAPTRNAPKDERDAAIAAQNNMVIALDNLSTMHLWLSDVLCRIATGSGFATRELFTNADERVFSAKRPIIINGIEDGIISQGDLLNRMILVTLEPPAKYVSEEDMNDLFLELHPGILGALLTAASTALRNRRKVQLENPPRMADFARWVVAAESVLPWKPGTFMNAYAENQDNASSIITESSPVAKAILQFIEKHPDGWQGLIGTLHTELQAYEVYKSMKSAPRTPSKLSGQLKRVAPALRVQGVDIQALPRQKHGSEIKIDVGKPPSGVGKNDPTYTNTSPVVEPNYNQNIADGVGSVGKSPILSTYLTSLSQEEKRENREDKREIINDTYNNGNLPTLPTPSTPTEAESLDQKISKVLASLRKGQAVSTPDGWCVVDNIGLNSVSLSRYGVSLPAYTGARILLIQAS